MRKVQWLHGCLETHFVLSPGAARAKGHAWGPSGQQGALRARLAKEPQVPGRSREHPHSLPSPPEGAQGPGRPQAWGVLATVSRRPGWTSCRPQFCGFLLPPASTHPTWPAPSAPPPTSQRSLLTNRTVRGSSLARGDLGQVPAPLLRCHLGCSVCGRGGRPFPSCPATHARSPGGQSPPTPGAREGMGSSLSHAGGWVSPAAQPERPEPGVPTSG